MKQTILGAGGAIGIELAKALVTYTSDIRLVARNPKKINITDELLSANLLNKEEVMRAVNGSSVVYVVIGLAYNTKIWQQQWPVLVKNIVDACTEYGCKLVFFDNVYAIGGDQVKHITELSPISPTSKKGTVRAIVDEYILTAIASKKIDAIIARAPDFYGSAIDKSMLMTMVYNPLKKGKKAQWICNPKAIHSMGYTPDLAKGTAILGNTPSAYNQIWNLPTSTEKITGEEWIQLFAEAMQVKNRYQVLPKWGIQSLGLFIPILKELSEMCYQYDRNYYFDSTKFNNQFNFTPTVANEAIQQIMAILNNTKTAV
ncbi:MAG: NAD(P)H-binding protein [Bacteroidota bacterium]|jgi:nucleoside-diphosphate-sugar epimerase|nr:NAD(P)H-binding protein [Bacteroidota bacterium]